MTSGEPMSATERKQLERQLQVGLARQWGAAVLELYRKRLADDDERRGARATRRLVEDLERKLPAKPDVQLRPRKI